MCVTTKSSNLVRAPGASSRGVRDGLECRHWTAWMYDFLSSTLRVPLPG